jgi:hypothetical protein
MPLSLALSFFIFPSVFLFLCQYHFVVHPSQDTSQRDFYILQYLLDVSFNLEDNVCQMACHYISISPFFSSWFCDYAVFSQVYFPKNSLSPPFSLSLRLSCDSRFQRAFTACSCVFKEITLVGSNQGNYFENATACSKCSLKTGVATQLKTFVTL